MVLGQQRELAQEDRCLYRKRKSMEISMSAYAEEGLCEDMERRRCPRAGKGALTRNRINCASI